MNLIHHWLFQSVWLLFAIYWFVAARSAKKNQIVQSPLRRIFHLALVILALGLIGGHYFDFGPMAWQILPQNEITFFTGAVLLLAGLGFAVWARVHLGQYWSGSVALKAGHHLIQTGPYRWVRHPIYTGILIGIAGTAVAIGEVRGFFALGLLTLIFWFKSRSEERLLMTQFGQEYTRYREEVGALLPFPPLPKVLFWGATVIAIAFL